MLFKGFALVAVLACCIATGDTSAILIAMTATNLLAAPDGSVGMAVGRVKLLSNLLALAAALPVLILVELRPEPEAALLLALAVCLLAASGTSQGGAGAATAAMAMPVLLTLLGLHIPTTAEGTGLAGALWTGCSACCSR